MCHFLVTSKFSSSLQILAQHFWKLLFKNYEQPGCVELFSARYREFQNIPQILPILDREGADVVLSIFTKGLFSGQYTDHCSSILRLFAHTDECIRSLLERRIFDVILTRLKVEANVACMSLIADGMTILMGYS